MKYISSILISLIIFGCQKDESINPIVGLWSEGFPYNADEYAKIPEYSSIVIYKDGYNVSTSSSVTNYSSHDDPALREYIEQSLDQHVPEDRKSYYLNYLDNLDFRKATSPRSAAKILGGMAEGRYNPTEGKWEDPNNLTVISQQILDWVIGKEGDRRLIIADTDRPEINPGLGNNQGSMAVWTDQTIQGEPSGYKPDVLVWKGNVYDKANPLNFTTVLGDEIGSSLPLNGDAGSFSDIAEVMQGLARVRLAQLYASNYGLQEVKDGTSVGARYADMGIMGFLNGWKSTQNIENGLGAGYLNTTHTQFPSGTENTIEEIIRKAEATKGDNSTYEEMAPLVQTFYSTLFDTPITTYSTSNLNKMLDAGHNFFNFDVNRILIYDQLK